MGVPASGCPRPRIPDVLDSKSGIGRRQVLMERPKVGARAGYERM